MEYGLRSAGGCNPYGIYEYCLFNSDGGVDRSFGFIIIGPGNKKIASADTIEGIIEELKLILDKDNIPHSKIKIQYKRIYDGGIGSIFSFLIFGLFSLLTSLIESGNEANDEYYEKLCNSAAKYYEDVDNMKAVKTLKP